MSDTSDRNQIPPGWSPGQPEKNSLHERLENDLRYHAPGNEAIGRHSALRGAALVFGHNMIDQCTPGRELSLALTKLEECLFFANASVARYQ